MKSLGSCHSGGHMLTEWSCLFCCFSPTVQQPAFPFSEGSLAFKQSAPFPNTSYVSSHLDSQGGCVSEPRRGPWMDGECLGAGGRTSVVRFLPGDTHLSCSWGSLQSGLARSGADSKLSGATCWKSANMAKGRISRVSPSRKRDYLRSFHACCLNVHCLYFCL